MANAPSPDTDEEPDVHRAVSDDGTEIVGRVHGEGQPLILVHGALEDGDLAWNSILPILTERFTCYCMNTRGRGLSAEPSNPDYSSERLVQDVTSFADSIGESVGLAGHSSGAGLALSAAAQTDAISAVAAYEPLVPSVINEDDATRVQDAIVGVGEAVDEDRLADAARIPFENSPIATADDVIALSEADYFEKMARYVPLNLKEREQAAESEVLGFSAPSVLARITVPVLLLHGSQSSNWATESTDYLTDYLADSRIVEIDGAGHFGPQFWPATVADELIQFFKTD